MYRITIRPKVPLGPYMTTGNDELTLSAASSCNTLLPSIPVQSGSMHNSHGHTVIGHNDYILTLLSICAY